MSNTLLREGKFEKSPGFANLAAAIRHGLRGYGAAGASIAFGLAVTPAIAQDTGAQAADQKSQSLETIVVTGSNIRRVDIETSNPVVTIDKAAIQQSGKLTQLHPLGNVAAPIVIHRRMRATDRP